MTGDLPDIKLTDNVPLKDTGSVFTAGNVIERVGLGTCLAVRHNGDSVNRWLVDSDGVFKWGSGSASIDTNLYRVAANSLKTDSAFNVGGDLTLSGNLILTGGTVSYGAADSAGAGFRFVRVPN